MHYASMKIVQPIILVILVLLAVTAGAAKLSLQQQDVEFFGRFGFSNLALVLYGLVQAVAGLSMVFRRTRWIGAAVVAITFVTSLVLLVMDGNIPASIATVVATFLLGVVMRQSRQTDTAES